MIGKKSGKLKADKLPGDKMSQVMNILGLQIMDYSAQEALELVKEYLENDCLNSLELLTPELFVAADEDPELKEAIRSMDLCMAREKEILSILEMPDPQRVQEIEDNVFLRELIKMLQSEHKSLFLLTNTEMELEKFYEYMAEHHPMVNIVGSCATDTNTGDEDVIVNEINSVVPDVVMAALNSPFQEEFVIRNKQKINAKVWVGLGKSQNGMSDTGIKTSWLSKLIEKSIFKRRVTKYRDQEKENQEE